MRAIAFLEPSVSMLRRSASLIIRVSGSLLNGMFLGSTSSCTILITVAKCWRLSLMKRASFLNQYRIQSLICFNSCKINEYAKSPLNLAAIIVNSLEGKEEMGTTWVIICIRITYLTLLDSKVKSVFDSSALVAVSNLIPLIVQSSIIHMGSTGSLGFKKRYLISYIEISAIQQLTIYSLSSPFIRSMVWGRSSITLRIIPGSFLVPWMVKVFHLAVYPYAIITHYLPSIESSIILFASCHILDCLKCDPKSFLKWYSNYLLFFL
jgi:hypothetical protein